MCLKLQATSTIVATFAAARNEPKRVDALIAPSQFAKEIHSQRELKLPIVHLPILLLIRRTEVLRSRAVMLRGWEHLIFCLSDDSRS